MGIKRYTATKDNTITNAFKQNLITRGTGSNMGYSDVAEVFSIYGQAVVQGTGPNAGKNTQELSRVLYEFPVSGSSTGQIKYDRTQGTLPASGSVNFYLKVFNARHGQTLPLDASYLIQAVSQSWTEGTGLDMEEYTNLGSSNWLTRSAGRGWGEVGGSYWSGSYNPGVTFPTYTVIQPNGTENFEVDITSMVEEWVAGTKQNYGLGIRLAANFEAYFSASKNTDNYDTGEINNQSGAQRSYYTKKMFARGTQYFFKRPVIEARWDSSRKDNRGNFYYSSSLANTADNLNTVYLYNYIDGQLKNIPGLTNNLIYVQMFSGSADNSAPGGTNLLITTGSMMKEEKFYVTGGLVSTGIYSASVCMTASATGKLSKIFDVWSGGAASNIQYATGAIGPITRYASSIVSTPKYVSKITNLKSAYNTNEVPEFRVFVRDQNWSPNVYLKATENIETKIIEDAYYRVFRVSDHTEAVQYGTGSSNLDFTRLSYDVSGNYFELDLSLLKADAMYGITLAYNIGGEYVEQPELFKFRIEK